MRIRKKRSFYVGIFLLVFLGLSYFWKVEVESGGNYVVNDSLLGILIFHNPFVLIFYLVLIVLIILSGVAKFRIK